MDKIKANNPSLVLSGGGIKAAAFHIGVSLALKQKGFNVGKDQSFAFGISDTYKAELKQSNAKMDEYFDQYISEAGDWDFEKLNVHRTILDNIENIVDAAFKQGLSQGTSNVVKQAVNPSDVNPSSSSAPSSASSEDKVRQQILNALQGGDDTLRMKF